MSAQDIQDGKTIALALELMSRVHERMRRAELTPGEQEIALMVLTGMTGQAIAGENYTEEASVRKTISKIARKFDIPPDRGRMRIEIIAAMLAPDGSEDD